MKLHLTTILISALTFTGCTKSTDGGAKPDADSQAKPIEIKQEVANATSSFAFDFFKTVQTEYVADDNIFLSPLSLHMALGMVVNGAGNDTKSEILKALHAENINIKDLNVAYSKLLQELPAADPKVKMTLANAIFHKTSFPFETVYLNQMKNDFNAQVTGLPFVPSDVAIINKWANDNTNGKIPKVLQALDPHLVMILMNALYFKGDWTRKFDKKDTKDEQFTGENGARKTVKMMKQEGVFDYTENEDYQVINLPYGNQQFRATILLPKPGKSIKSIYNSLSLSGWDELQQKMRGTNTIVSLPKFKLEKDTVLNNTLKKMGMTKAFNESLADFSTMSKVKPLFIGFVKQNTFVEVNEEGTEAAAVTTTGMLSTSAPQLKTVIFNCNRPFGIIISEKTSNTILFMGRIMHP
ncbi:serpin family protein [Haoranjiania flava]|uniref:Serpin family protein n=1 Tax=Haoranjiania flava TaxID=1856322 RepID=A0AAE3ILZ5_9BACT|nr:serpin family protein [Haoranjiania flava]MCU7693410.1 serpin family protein [Haoranjiania flava]